MSDDLDATRQRMKDLLHKALHTLGARIPDLTTGDCHCNLLAEVALDALAPALVDLAAAERRAGHAKAVANLRDSPAYLAWHKATQETPFPALLTTRRQHQDIARYLEAQATKETSNV